MTSGNRLGDLDLASLIGSRICHDLISPIGAISNGLEVLQTSDDEEMRKVALDLIGNSARAAARKLAFARLAFGAAGSMGSDISLGDAQDIAEEFLKEDRRVTLNWQAPRENRPKVIVKLLLNLMLLGISCIPRGGEVTVKTEGDALLVEAKGPRAALPEKTAKVLTGEMPAADVDAHMVQPYYTLLLLEESGYGLDIEQATDDTVLLRAAP